MVAPGDTARDLQIDDAVDDAIAPYRLAQDGAERSKRHWQRDPQRRSRTLITVNAAIVVNMRQDEPLRKAVEAGDLIVPDGMPVVFASRLLGTPLAARVAGVDLMARQLLEDLRAVGHRHDANGRVRVVVAVRAGIGSRAEPEGPYERLHPGPDRRIADAQLPLHLAEVSARAKEALQQTLLLAIEPGEAADAAAVVARVLASPIGRRAARSTRCRREVPVTLADETGAVVEGVVDVVFDEGDRSVVVDFKTDIEIGRLGLDRYRRQVGLYAAAVGLATGRPVEAILLRV